MATIGGVAATPRPRCPRATPAVALEPAGSASRPARVLEYPSVMDTLLDAIWTLSWRTYPAALVTLLGAWLVARGIHRELPGIRLSVADPHKGIAMARALRSVLVGLALAGIGVGWASGNAYLFGLCCVIGGEEALETSVVIAAMEDAERKGVWARETPVAP